ncbi:MAG TPA: cation:proton antiporter [Gemmataceae bacterium]|nr:cation:proton antiporter [Gemmataceae bacterium]
MPAELLHFLDSFRRLSIEELLLPILIQLAVLIASARLFGWLFRKLGQPNTVGEIAAGLALGPSLLGWLLPQVSRMLFQPEFPGVPHEIVDPALQKTFAVLSQIGLILLLFLVGLEFDFSHLKWHGPAALSISIAGIALPFGLGLLLAPLLLQKIEPFAPNEPVPALGFTLFLGVALSITALPVLGRMIMEWGIGRTKLGTVAITAAAVNDAVGWILLAAVAAVVRGKFRLLDTLVMIGLSAAFALFMIFVGRPLLLRWARTAVKRGNGDLGLNDLAILLVLMLACAAITNWIGIFAIFGAFLLGAVLSSEAAFREAISRRLHDLVTAFFLPIFFTYTGLRTDVRSLGSWEMWLLGGVVIAAAIVGKFAGCTLAARIGGLRMREAACIGAMMNTRGLMELIVINLGYELRVIPQSVFCMLVLMAMTTTLMTTPLLMRFMRGTELEAPIRASGFLRPP